jgi:hypothetical protein
MKTRIDTHSVRWCVSLSNGEDHKEGKGIFAEYEGELSPWQQLQQYLFKNKLVIRNLYLETQRGQRYMLPSMGKNPKAGMLANTAIPLDYNMFRFLGRDMNVTKEEGKMVARPDFNPDWFTVAEAIFPGYRLQVWVNERNTLQSWSLITPN